MTQFHTERNYISVGRVLPGDRFVATYFQPEPSSTKMLLCIEPIEQLEQALRWALEMADCMAGPLTVMPIKSDEELLRKMVEAIGLEGLWRQDPEEQQAGRELLVQLGVLRN